VSLLKIVNLWPHRLLSLSLAYSHQGLLRHCSDRAWQHLSVHALADGRWQLSQILSRQCFEGQLGRFRELCGKWPRDRSTWQCRARWIGTVYGILVMWHLTVWSRTGGRPVWFATSSLGGQLHAVADPGWCGYAGVAAWSADQMLLHTQCAARVIVFALFAAGQTRHVGDGTTAPS